MEKVALMLTIICCLIIVANIALFFRIRKIESKVSIFMNSFRSSSSEGLEIEKRAPDFDLNDLDNFRVSLRDFLGTKVLLVFSSPNCEKCKLMYSDLKLFSQFNPDIQILMISHGPVEENRRIAAEEKFGFPILTYKDTVIIDYRVPGVPYSYFIDEEGKIRNKGFTNNLNHFEKVMSPSGKVTTSKIQSEDK